MEDIFGKGPSEEVGGAPASERDDPTDRACHHHNDDDDDDDDDGDS